MNLNNIINEIEKVDPEVYDRMDTRRNSMRQFAKTSGKIALATVPVLFSGMLKKAYAGTSVVPPIVDVLNFALTLEYLEAEFYMNGVNAAGLIPSGSGIDLIATDEAHHVDYLIAAIQSIGGTPVTKPTFDFSGGNGSGNGPFKTAFSDYMLFLAVAQTLEDTGVRAYKGQAPNLISNNAVLTAALNIHSVEARHASHIRSVRGSMLNTESLKPWITGNETGGLASSVQANYNGEENTNQGVEIVGIGGYAIIDAKAASEAFDEPLSMKAVLKIVDPFIV